MDDAIKDSKETLIREISDNNYELLREIIPAMDSRFKDLQKTFFDSDEDFGRDEDKSDVVDEKRLVERDKDKPASAPESSPPSPPPAPVSPASAAVSTPTLVSSAPPPESKESDFPEFRSVPLSKSDRKEFVNDLARIKLNDATMFPQLEQFKEFYRQNFYLSYEDAMGDQRVIGEREERLKGIVAYKDYIASIVSNDELYEEDKKVLDRLLRRFEMLTKKIGEQAKKLDTSYTYYTQARPDFMDEGQGQAFLTGLTSISARTWSEFFSQYFLCRTDDPSEVFLVLESLKKSMKQSILPD